ncbi:MAG: thiamine phosphate synthase [Alphaproteobacteria bacterium]|nr:thiamine phosphate synthase [Alphaproteobacteria bacterium]
MNEDDLSADDFASRFQRETRPRCQLYLVSSPDLAGSSPERLKQVLGSGEVAAFQLRLKALDDDEIARLAEPLQRICADHDVAFILNDNAALAAKIGADGVHLGQSDGSVAEARALLGREAQIGITCHASRHLAMEAAEAGADYVAFGSFYPSATKTSEHRPEPSILSWWTTLFGTPCVAIGGIMPCNAAPLVAAGADYLAVSSAIWNAPDMADAVRAFERVMSG